MSVRPRPRWYPRPRARTLLAAAGCTLVVGCGGGAGLGAFAAAADRVCAQANGAAAGLAAQIALAQRGSDSTAVYRAVAVLTRRRAVAARRALAQLDALDVPDAQRDRVKGWIADQRHRQTLVDALALAFARRQDARISTLSQRIDALNSTSTAFAARHGLRDCARTVA